MDKTKKYSIWSGSQALFDDWTEHPKPGQSVLLALDRPTRPRFVQYTMLLGEKGMPERLGFVSHGLIAEGTFIVIYTPEKGFVYPTGVELSNLKLPADREGKITGHAYLEHAKAMLREYRGVIVAEQKARAERAASVLTQDPVARQEQLQAALAAFLAEQSQKLENLAPTTPTTPINDKAEMYAKLTPEEKHKFLIEEIKTARQELDMLGQKQIGLMGGPEREQHFETIKDQRAYVGKVASEKMRIERLLGISSRSSFRGHRGQKPLPGRRGPPR